MDGNTWHSYRAVTARGNEPPFFLEPDNPCWLPDAFRGAGFDAVASYASAIQDRIDVDPERVAGVALRAKRLSIRVRGVDPDHFEAELRGLHALCMRAFRSSFLFAPNLCPDLGLVAEESGAPVAFVLALADPLDRRRAGDRTLIVKTVATLPGRAYAGLPHLLAAQVGAAAGAWASRAPFTR